MHRSLPFVASARRARPVERLGAADPALVAIEARRIADGRREAAIVERPALQALRTPGAEPGRLRRAARREAR